MGELRKEALQALFKVLIDYPELIKILTIKIDPNSKLLQGADEES